jgi:hypothetical protein
MDKEGFTSIAELAHVSDAELKSLGVSKTVHRTKLIQLAATTDCPTTHVVSASQVHLESVSTQKQTSPVHAVPHIVVPSSPVTYAPATPLVGCAPVQSPMSQSASLLFPRTAELQPLYTSVPTPIWCRATLTQTPFLNNTSTHQLA